MPGADEDRRSKYLLDMIDEAKGTGTGPMGTHKTQIGPLLGNVPVTVLASALIWGLAIYCMADPTESKADLQAMKTSVTGFFTWAYIGSNGIWFFFIIAIYYWYGNVKLGKDDEKPEFDDANYFVMIFCAGVAIGLFFYGASEPMWHYLESTGANRYSGAGYLNENEKATDAINVTLYHWGVHGWVVYTMTAVCLGILSYRYGLPLTYRTCFFPIFGKVTWGWIGDLIDSCTIAASIAGVCTSLGLGAQQIITGMQRIGVLNPTCVAASVVGDGNETFTDAGSVGIDCLSEDNLTSNRCILIALITILATISVISGLDKGIKLLSQIAFSGGMALLCIVFILDDHWYILNVVTQAFGVYIQWIIQIGWFTDAFAQLKFGEGHSLDGEGANSAWMDWWTIFYWGWWISWSPFVGVFLARISRGRTIREVINFTFSIPLVYCILWFSTFGGAAIRMHRRAELLVQAGTELHGDATYFKDTAAAGDCYKVPESVLPAGFTCPKKPEGGWPTGATWPQKCPTYAEKYAVSDLNISPVCKFVSSASDSYWFDLMGQYYQLGNVLNGFTIFTIIIYFVTSSDSGSLVVDYIASNGEEAHWSQRIYWAFTEGALAVALLLAGGSDSLKALQAVSIISGVPLTVFCCFICLSLWFTLKCDAGEFVADQYNTWLMPLYGGVFDYMEFLFSFGKSSLPNPKHIWGFFVGLLFPPAILCQTCAKTSSMSPAYKTLLPTFAIISWCGFLFSMIAKVALPKVGFQGLEFFFYCCHATCVVAVRYEIRTLYNIEGGGLRDSLAAFCCYPQAVWQCFWQVDQGEAKPKVQESTADAELAPPAKETNAEVMQS